MEPTTKQLIAKEARDTAKTFFADTLSLIKQVAYASKAPGLVLRFGSHHEAREMARAVENGVLTIAETAADSAVIATVRRLVVTTHTDEQRMQLIEAFKRAGLADFLDGL